MTHSVEPAEPPVTSAVEELARDDVERKKFLKMAGKTMGGGAAAVGLSAFIAACGSSSSSSSSAKSSAPASSSASSSSSSGDLAIVNYALTLEYLESAFYAAVLKSNLFHGKVLATLKSFGMDEDQHVVALKKAATSLGTPAAKPTPKFPPLNDAATVTKLAAKVENLGAAAYLGQAGNIQSKQILASALAIHTVEARHAATLNTLLKMDITPDGAFAKPATHEPVLAAVKPFIA